MRGRNSKPALLNLRGDYQSGYGRQNQLCAGVTKWKTCKTRNLVASRPCEFESRHPHQQSNDSRIALSRLLVRVLSIRRVSGAVHDALFLFDSRIGDVARNSHSRGIDSRHGGVRQIYAALVLCADSGANTARPLRLQEHKDGSESPIITKRKVRQSTERY